MSFEVEVKYRVADHGRLARALAGLGAVAGPAVAQSDLYLAHPARDFALSNEAFRIRRSGDALFITYKGPKQPGPTKTREELEFGLAPGAETHETARRTFERLGFREVAEIRKERRAFELVSGGRAIQVALDLAEGLGAFAEVEAIADSASDLPAVQAAVLALAEKLGLADVEPRSYLRMTLERAAAGG